MRSFLVQVVLPGGLAFLAFEYWRRGEWALAAAHAVACGVQLWAHPHFLRLVVRSLLGLEP